MTDTVRENEEVDVDVYEGPPDFDKRQTLENGKQDEVKSDA